MGVRAKGMVARALVGGVGVGFGAGGWAAEGGMPLLGGLPSRVMVRWLVVAVGGMRPRPWSGGLLLVVRWRWIWDILAGWFEAVSKRGVGGGLLF